MANTIIVAPIVIHDCKRTLLFLANAILFGNDDDTCTIVVTCSLCLMLRQNHDQGEV